MHKCCIFLVSFSTLPLRKSNPGAGLSLAAAAPPLEQTLPASGLQGFFEELGAHRGISEQQPVLRMCKMQIPARAAAAAALVWPPQHRALCCPPARCSSSIISGHARDIITLIGVFAVTDGCCVLPQLPAADTPMDHGQPPSLWAGRGAEAARSPRALPCPGRCWGAGRCGGGYS